MALIWGDLMSFRPPAYIQAAIGSRGLWGVGWHFHRIEDGHGPVNMDRYTVDISQMPLASSVTPFPPFDPARRATPSELVYYIRTKLNMFVDSQLAGFEPYDIVPDAAAWATPVPLLAVIHIDMRDPRGALPPSSNPDDGSVCVTAATDEWWQFSTLFTPLDGGHPVSGNRRFGIEAGIAEGSYVFFARGADRPTGIIDQIVQSQVWESSHALWLSYQARIATFINQNGGQAQAGYAIAERHDWDAYEVQSQYHPTEAWI